MIGSKSFLSWRCWGAVGAVAMLATSMASAIEVTVQNDNFVSGGPATIVGDFVAGEEAGARLTMPCDGTVVALQVAWLDGGSGSGQVIQRFIHVYDGSSFPAPGSSLLDLDSPVLTPGAINEFRFLDENNTIPINIPVTAGQRLTVTLEFDAPTNVGAGGASVIRDNDGCTPGGNVLFAVPGGWLNFCSFLAGDIVVRVVVDCDDPDGACCLPDGMCATLSAADCATQGGTYQGDFVDCGAVSCPEPEGACCFEATGGCLDDRTEVNCGNIGGIWQGAGTDCGSIVCFPEGACCLTDGTCQPDMSPEDCTNLGGVFQGDGTICGPGTCPEPQGACCLSNGVCFIDTEANCGIASGTWAGGGTNCDDNSGSGTADICEAAPCPSDLDGSGTVDLSDLSILLGDFGCNSAPCVGDVNNDGVTDLTDLAILLADFGLACP